MYAETQIIDHATQVWSQEINALNLVKDDIEQLANPRPSDHHAKLRTVSGFTDTLNGDYYLALSDASPAAELMVRAWVDINASRYMNIKGDDPVVKDRTERATKLINEFIIPSSAMSLPELRPIMAGSRADAFAGNCVDAEQLFDAARRQGVTGRGAQHTQLSVYHDEKGKPVILRKENSYSSGLTLEPIALGEVVIPAGTIVAVGRKMSETSKLTGQKRLAKSRQYTFGIEGPVSISPSRLSPWAFEDLDKSLFSVRGKVGQMGCRGDRLKLLTATSLEDFRVAARKIMQRCGVQAS